MSRGTDTQSGFFRPVMVVLVIALGLTQLYFGIEAQRVFIGADSGGSGLISAGAAQTETARGYYLEDGNLLGSRNLILEVLVQSPAYVPAWLLLAEIEYDLGNGERANSILNYVDELTQGLKRYRWEKALVAYTFGRRDILARELGFIARELGGTTGNEALRLAFALWEDPQELLDALGRETLMELFLYAARFPHLDTALYYWGLIEERGMDWRESDLLTFIDMLFNMGRLSESAVLWKRYFNPDSILYDERFNVKPQRHAFSWRSDGDRSFKTGYEEGGGGGSRVVHYRFTGWDNPSRAFLEQIVPLADDRIYRFRVEMKSRGITTDQRPYWEATGYGCGLSAERSVMVYPEQEWVDYTLEFRVPSGCEAVQLRLRRDESLQIDNRLSGDLWLRNLRLEAMRERYTMSGEPKG